MIRVLTLLLVLVGMPVFAADYTPWPGQDEASSVEQLLAQAAPSGPGAGQGTGQGGSSQQQQRPKPRQLGDEYPGRYCCRHCRATETPCGGECLAPFNGKPASCNQAPGCACSGKP
jgi:hypothetical protein